MTEAELEAMIRAMTFSSGKGRLTLDELASIQPGLARLMPEVGQRTWKLYYAAQAENWPMAKFQYKEIVGLLELGAFMRPKHGEALQAYLRTDWKPLEIAIQDRDFAAFDAAFRRAVEAANVYHDLRGKPFIQWKLPDTPPPDLDLRPRKGGPQA